MSLIRLIDDIGNGYNPNLNEVEDILNINQEEVQYLFKMADEIRKIHCGDKVHLRGIIEFSNYCKGKCLYCGINKENNSISRYRMKPDEIIDNAKEAYQAGYRTIVLQSGEDYWYTKEIISYIIRGIKEIGDIAITLSVGERGFDDYQEWYKNGADRFLMKHETADYKLYNYLHPHSNYYNRIRSLKWLRTIGYQVGSGFIIGLPKQTTRIIAKDILLLKGIKADMAGIGPIIPHDNTVLKSNPFGDPFMTLKTVALTRIIIKQIHLPATTALKVADKTAFEKAFYVGVNVIMHKLEPIAFRSLYDIYPKPADKRGSIKDERLEVETFIRDIAREVSDDKGDSLRQREEA